MWAPIEDLVPGYPLSVVKYGPRLLEERRDLGDRFAVAILKAMRQFGRGKTPRNLELVQRAVGLDRELIERTCWPRMSETGLFDPALFRGYQEWSVANDLLGRVVEDDELFDLSFFERANETLATAAGQ